MAPVNQDRKPSIRVEHGQIVVRKGGETTRFEAIPSNVRYVDEWVGTYTHDDAFMDLLETHAGVRRLATS